MFYFAVYDYYYYYYYYYYYAPVEGASGLGAARGPPGTKVPSPGSTWFCAPSPPPASSQASRC